VDAGCGEGYYLDYIINNLSASETETSLSCIGIDISKAAIIAATKRNTRICWLVASNKLIPLLPASVDVIICMFGFPSYESFQTILKPGGRIILVDAGPLHLIELRERIYPIIKEVKDYDSSKLEQNGFVIQREDTLHYEARLDSNETIMQLMAMTPHLYRASREGIARIKTLQAISVTVDVVYRILARG
jgi:23S rRNA (guanine745-N1)-methyltransferase